MSLDLRRRAFALEYLTIGWNTVEAAVALAAGFVAGSIALIAFGLDSIVEVFAASVVLWNLRGVADPDRERRALRLIGASFFALAAYVVIESTRDLLTAARPEVSIVGIVLAAVSFAVMWFLAAAKLRTGRAMGSPPLIADSKETLLCSYLSGVLLLGVGANAAFGWWWADPVAGLGIAFLAAREGREAWTGEHAEHG